MTPDDADRLLRSYFQKAMPTPFPGFVEPVQAAAETRRPSDRSRLVLAAGVAGLLGLGLAVSGGFVRPVRPQPDPGPGLFQDATADGAKLLRSAATGR